jgi:hypothetical protein
VQDETIIKQYIEIRDYLKDYLFQMTEVFFSELWDPLMVHIVIKELRQLITKELSYRYPDFPIDYLPQVKISKDDDAVEAGIQIYFNSDKSLRFLGCIEYDSINYDLYCRKSWDPYFSHVFYARNGHAEDAFEKGSKEPAAEYMIGKLTPLSIAYSFAVEEGFVN